MVENTPDQVTKGFFSEYSDFGETSTVASDLNRLDFRYRHVIDRNRALLEDMRVLDIASHDSRFTFAAIKGAGAAHVTGIEARESLVRNGEKNLRKYGISDSKFRLVCGDVFEKIHDIKKDTIDTAMVLGFLYHTARQYELIASLSNLGIANIIVDSNVLPKAKRPIILLEWERTDSDAKIWDASRPKVLSSTPSAMALQMILEEFGYSVDTLKPQAPLPKSANQYATGARVTLVGRK